jgi:hypothetical protein
LYGVKKILTHEGRVRYQEDERFYNWSDDDLRAFGMDPNERYLKDKHGKDVARVCARTRSSRLAGPRGGAARRLARIEAPFDR